jgi:Domain of unknown function (DUF4349)
MRRTLIAIQLAFLLFGLAGCGNYSRSQYQSRATGLSAVAGDQPMTASYKVATVQLTAAPPETKRFVAVHHKLVVISPESELPKNWRAVIEFCGTIRCEVISSSIVTRTQESFPSGAITLRVVPEDFPRLLTQVEKQGNVVEHTTQSEDKTTEVVDTEARLKNLTAYRDSLRTMLGRPGLNVKDSVEIQEKLSDVQSNLDAEATKRKILANETEKVAAEIEFRVRDTSHKRGAFAALWEALGEAGETLAESLGSVVTFVVFIIPWILLFLLIGWFLRRLWRKRRAKKTALTVEQVGS